MPTETAVLIHIAAGLTALVLYWSPLLTRKGGGAHRAAGRAFMRWVAPLLLTVPPVIVAGAGRMGPPEIVQFAYLALCVATVAHVGWRAVARKADLAAFRSGAFRILGPLLFASGGALLAIGIGKSAPLPVVFSSIGLGFGAAMIRFTRIERPTANWWLVWHLNAVCLLFSAVHGTLAMVAWRHFVDPQAGMAVHVAAQLGGLAAALALRLCMGRRWRAPIFGDAARPGAPLLPA